MCVCLVGSGRNVTAQQLSSSPLDTKQHMSGITEEVGERYDGKVQQSSTSGSAMREMHDSSSSWTDRSLPPRAKGLPAAKHQAAATYVHAADAYTSQMDRLKPVCPTLVAPDVSVDMPGCAAVCTDQAVTAVPGIEVAENGRSCAT